MTENNGLKPDNLWLQAILKELREKDPIYQTATINRLTFELTLLEKDAQERHIKVLQESIESQDRLAKNQNFLAWAALIFALVQILLTIFLR